jgi:hypothetical protein
MFNAWITNHLDFIEYLPYTFSIAVICFFLIGWCYGKFLIRKSTGLVVRDSIASAIFGLSALVLGFTFSNAANHFDTRANNIRSEAMSLNRVYASTRYLNASDQPAIQNSLRELLRLRLQTFQSLNSMNELDDNLQRSINALQSINEQITLAIPRTSDDQMELADKILRVQLNNLMDVFNSGFVNAKNHPPLVILEFLFTLLCIGALLSGYAMAIEKEEDWLLTTIYLALTGYALFVIFSLEFPNQLFNYDAVNYELLKLQNTMK